MITLFTAATPNGRKISIALEELGLPYEVRAIDLRADEQKQDWYLAINPNGRIPAIVDHDDGGITVFESGAILIYLAEKTGRLLPTDPLRRFDVLQWLFLQIGGVGPMQGQVHVFYHYLDNALPAATQRYQDETRRLYGVVDRQLSSHDYVAGEFSIADIAMYPWLAKSAWAGVDIDEFPNVSRWLARLAQRDSVARGMQVPPDVTDAEKVSVGQAMTGPLPIGK